MMAYLIAYLEYHQNSLILDCNWGKVFVHMFQAILTESLSTLVMLLGVSGHIQADGACQSMHIFIQIDIVNKIIHCQHTVYRMYLLNGWYY